MVVVVVGPRVWFMKYVDVALAQLAHTNTDDSEANGSKETEGIGNNATPLVIWRRQEISESNKSALTKPSYSCFCGGLTWTRE